MGLFGKSKKDRRHKERVRIQGAASAFGEVLDLSETGACLFRKGGVSYQAGDTLQLDIRQGATELSVEAVVVRVQTIGFKRYEVGVEFSEITPAERALIRVLQRNDIHEQVGPRAYVAA